MVEAASLAIIAALAAGILWVVRDEMRDARRQHGLLMTSMMTTVESVVEKLGNAIVPPEQGADDTSGDTPRYVTPTEPWLQQKPWNPLDGDMPFYLRDPNAPGVDPTDHDAALSDEPVPTDPRLRAAFTSDTGMGMFNPGLEGVDENGFIAYVQAQQATEAQQRQGMPGMAEPDLTGEEYGDG